MLHTREWMRQPTSWLSVAAHRSPHIPYKASASWRISAASWYSSLLLSSISWWIFLFLHNCVTDSETPSLSQESQARVNNMGALAYRSSSQLMDEGCAIDWRWYGMRCDAMCVWMAEKKIVCLGARWASSYWIANALTMRAIVVDNDDDDNRITACLPRMGMKYDIQRARTSSISVYCILC